MPVGIRANGCRTAQARSTICMRRCVAMSITPRAQANGSLAVSFMPWHGSDRNSTGSNCSFLDSSGSRRNYLPSARPVLTRNGCLPGQTGRRNPFCRRLFLPFRAHEDRPSLRGHLGQRGQTRLQARAGFARRKTRNVARRDRIRKRTRLAWGLWCLATTIFALRFNSGDWSGKLLRLRQSTSHCVGSKIANNSIDRD